MFINNKLVVNKSYLKSLFASPTALPISKDQRQVNLIGVYPNVFTGDFL